MAAPLRAVSSSVEEGAISASLELESLAADLMRALGFEVDCALRSTPESTASWPRFNLEFPLGKQLCCAFKARRGHEGALCFLRLAKLAAASSLRGYGVKLSYPLRCSAESVEIFTGYRSHDGKPTEVAKVALAGESSLPALPPDCMHRQLAGLFSLLRVELSVDIRLPPAAVSVQTYRSLQVQLSSVDWCPELQLHGQLVSQNELPRIVLIEEEVMSDELKQAGLLANLSLGTIELEAQQALGLRPGHVIDLDMPLPLQVTLRIGATSWAVAELRCQGERISLAIIRDLLCQETSSAD